MLTLVNPVQALAPKKEAASNSFIDETFEFGKKQKSESSSLLKTLKELEQGKKWKDCAEQSSLAFKKHPTLRPWILQTWTICTGRWLKESNANKGGLEKVWSSFDAHRAQIEESIAWKSMRAELLKSVGTLIELELKNDPKKLTTWVQRYAEIAEDKDSRSKALAWNGEIAMALHQLGAAESFFEQSLQLSEVKAVRDRLSSVRLALNAKKEEPTNGKAEILPEGEQKYEERFRTSLKNNDLLAFMEDATSYLNQYPTGRRAKWCFEKVQEIFQNYSDKAASEKNGTRSSDKAPEEKYSTLRDRALAILGKLDSSRQIELAKASHRRGDFASTLTLGEKALGSIAASSQAAQLLYVVGRSAQFVGDYKKARTYFEQYLEFHSAGEDVNEVQFRLALVHFRMAQYSSAVAVLERLLLAKGADRYDLLGRYWLIRALQATQNARANDEIKTMLEKYPLSYYGLRLRAEKQNGILESWPTWPTDKKLAGTVTWAPFQKQIWDRALELGKNGWLAEAQAELTELTYGSKPETKTLIAEQLFHHQIYSLALRMTMDVVDQNPDYRCLEIISLALPEAYDQLIQTQARKYNLSPVLVRSLIRQESAFNEKATSTSKAMGLMQLIPPTAAEVAQDLGLQGLELPQDSYLPVVNVPMGTSYIARMIKQFGGNVPMGLAAYNAGPTRLSLFVKARPEVQELTSRMSSEPVDEIWFDELPWNETSFYVKAILRNTILYRLKSGDKVLLGPVLWSDLRLVP